MRQHQSILEFGRGRYLKLALWLCALAIGAYSWHDAALGQARPYGGTWLGYTLGGVCAALVLWLMLLGVRKRRYASRLGTVQGWTSAHVYLGTSLLLLATLHSAFEFGWNVHTLAYALLVVVIASGAFGVFAYLRYPELVTRNAGDSTMEAVLLEIADLDRKSRRLALDLPDDANQIVMRATRAAVRDVARRRSFLRELKGDRVRCPTREASRALAILGARYPREQAAVNAQLVAAMTRKSVLVDRLRRDLRYRALLEIWLYFHVPLSFALLAALAAHVVSVFFFW